MVMEVWGLTGGTLVERRGSCEAQSAAWPSLLAQARPGEARHVSRPRPTAHTSLTSQSPNSVTAHRPQQTDAEESLCQPQTIALPSIPGLV